MDKVFITIKIKIKIVAQPERSIIYLIAYKVFDFGLFLMRLNKNTVHWTINKKYSYA